MSGKELRQNKRVNKIKKIKNKIIKILSHFFELTFFIIIYFNLYLKPLFVWRLIFFIHFCYGVSKGVGK